MGDKSGGKGTATFNVGAKRPKVIRFTSLADLAEKVDELVEKCWPGEMPVCTEINYNNVRTGN